jgi:hypothetical protein
MQLSISLNMLSKETDDAKGSLKEISVPTCGESKPQMKIKKGRSSGITY